MIIPDIEFYSERNKFIDNIIENIDSRIEQLQKDLSKSPKLSRSYFILTGTVQAMITIKEEILQKQYKLNK
jgi:hypothetical protein|tara:strand:- start:491 stop:703 length:213 start_codon:yes stop_codon:yes gene_type:complete